MGEQIVDAAPSPPIPDYDQLPAERIVTMIEGLDREDLAELIRYERSNKHRRRIVAEVERRLAA
jgi:hypothetical protein